MVEVDSVVKRNIEDSQVNQYMYVGKKDLEDMIKNKEQLYKKSGLWSQ